MKRLAKSALEELGGSELSPALQLAAKGRLDHAERDLLRMFRARGMSLDVPISSYTFGPLSVPHLKVKHWFKHLLRDQSELVFGGFRRGSSEAKLAMLCFWENLRGCMPDHAIFRTHRDRLQNCLPIYLFLDEGVGLRKSGVLVISMQVVLGCETARNFMSALKKAEERNPELELDATTLKEIMTKSQSHNSAGRTYNSRFLYTVLPKKMYKKNTLMTDVLDKLAVECVEVLDGVSCSERNYPICIGVKGDAPMLIRAGNFTRGFTHMGRGRGVCWECRAGETNFDFEDVRLLPSWASTVHTSRPYEVPSPLLQIPAQRVPEAFFKRDPFHTFKQSIGCSFLSSSIVLLCELGYFPGQSDAVTEQLRRAYEDFAFWTKHEWPGRTMQSMKMFTKELFHWPRKEAFPAGRFKGSDCMLMLRWLHHMVREGFVRENAPAREHRSPLAHPLEEWHVPFFVSLLKASNAGIQFFHILARSGVWLERDKAQELGLFAAEFTQAFSKLARLCHARGMPRFHLVPALHAFHHFYWDTKAFLELPDMPSVFLSPAVAGCEADEDFVGKTARLTRKVHARSTTQRTLERYCVKMWCEQHDIR